MNHKEKLVESYNKSSCIDDIRDIPAEQQGYIGTIAEKSYIQKGVYTVLVTLLTHKILDPKQDIRYHQTSLPNGFSGRTVDTQYITPTLKELGMPSMAESGWLTRSLEQPYPYTLTYNGHISDKVVKKAFLQIIDYVQKNPSKAQNTLRFLLHKVLAMREANKVPIVPLQNPEKLSVDKIIECLSEHFFHKYSTFGGSKLPVLAFYAIYKILLSEMKRFEGCSLAKLGSLTACDRTSSTAGDILIFKGKELFEALEIKLDRAIDMNVVRIAIEKIIKHNPKRYYILSSKDVLAADKSDIAALVQEIKEDHGCQIIVNGVVPSLKYYLRLVTSLEDFLSMYSDLISEDTELKVSHKEKWNEILTTHNI